MTREQLLAIAEKHNLRPNIINLLDELCLIKIDEPPKLPTVMEKLENELRKRYFHDGEMIGLKQALKDLDLEIVEKPKPITKTVR